MRREGAIRRADAPLQTYHWQWNRFFAGFIRASPVNFFDGMIMMSGGKLLLEAGTRPSTGDNSPLGAGFRRSRPFDRATGSYFRPAGDVRDSSKAVLDPPLDANAAALNLKVNVVQPMGNDMDIYMSTNLNDHMVARVETESAQGGTLGGGLRADAQATLYVDLRKVHFFEPGETGMDLSLTNETDHAAA